MFTPLYIVITAVWPEQIHIFSLYLHLRVHYKNVLLISASISQKGVWDSGMGLGGSKVGGEDFWECSKED